jgi:acylphosphatase
LSERRTVRLVIHGRVQGVWFRDWTVETARAAGLSGWVRNRSDGSVEVMAIGASTTIRAFVARCHKGPPKAQVDRVEQFEARETLGPGFEKRATL